MVMYTDYDLFQPETLKTMFLDISPPDTLYRRLFGNPLAMGLHDFQTGAYDDPFKILPPVEDMEDAKAMLDEQNLESYSLQRYSAYVDISKKLLDQYDKAQNLTGMTMQVKDRYMLMLRQGVENTLEYICFDAMADKDATLSSSHNWTAGATTADEILEDLVLARKAYQEETRKQPTVAIHNPEAAAQMLLRKDLSSALYRTSGGLDEASIGRLLSMDHVEQAGGLFDYEGNSLSMFQPSTTGRNITHLVNPQALGKPVVLSAPEFDIEEIKGKYALRVYVNFFGGFVFNKNPYVATITS